MIPKYLMKSPEMRSLLEFAMHKGTITEDECYQFYASSQRFKDALRYLIANNLLQEIEDKLYRFVPQEEREPKIFKEAKEEKKSDEGEI